MLQRFAYVFIRLANDTVGRAFAYFIRNLDSLSRDSGTPILESAVNASPSPYDYKEWIGALYTLDGLTIHALVHNEFLGKDGSVEHFLCLSHQVRDRIDNEPRTALASSISPAMLHQVLWIVGGIQCRPWNYTQSSDDKISARIQSSIQPLGSVFGPTS